MIYLVLRKDTNEFIKVFNNYDVAVDFCKKITDNFCCSLRLISLDVEKSKVEENILF